VPRLLAALLLAAVALPASAQRLDADVDCKPTKHDLVYDCRFVVKEAKTGKPVSGAEVSVGADMPSMPMAHNVKPVKAQPAGAPGEYHARLDLEMLGVWAVKLRLSGPVRDQLVLHYEFDSKGATSVRDARQQPPAKHR
jgi:hypothetical protein